MKFFIDKGNGKVPLGTLSYVQTRQAAAIADGIARLIPQEGVDYDVYVTYKGENSPTLSMDIVALTDKGEQWKKYVSQFINKYPPVVDYKGDALPEDPSPSDFPETKEEGDSEKDEKVVS